MRTMILALTSLCIVFACGGLDLMGRRSIAVASASENAAILTPQSPETPRINGPRLFGVRPGHPFLFKIPATGQRPMRFVVDGLPQGLRLDSQSGQITGSLANRGEYAVMFRAENVLGRAQRKFKIVCGDKLALTPYMGWNSWYNKTTHVTDKDIRNAADAMVSTGMLNHGYSYIGIDVCWEMKPGSYDSSLNGMARDERGDINPNKRFPDMKALTDYIHSKGLKAGIYASPGTLTCLGYVGSMHHEEQDARRFAAWGFDLLKHDGTCSPEVSGNSNVTKRAYDKMGNALKRLDRDMVYNICHLNTTSWAREAGGNSVRTGSDLGEDIKKISAKVFGVLDLYGSNELQRLSGPGFWNDPDYLLLGQIADLHNFLPRTDADTTLPTSLTPDEQYTHMSLWCLLAAPLVLGGDITKLDRFTLSVLTNDEVLEVDQDPLGKAAMRVAKRGDLEIWAKDMEDGSKVLGLFNRGEREAGITARWADLKISGPQVVRDLWRQKDVGSFDEQFSTDVGPHGVVLVRLHSKDDGRVRH